MSLKVIGSGFGRTGTRSLKEALEILGLGPCHHMEEVFGHPEHVPYWEGVARGEAQDWEAVFAGYNSQVDWPGAHVWRETAEAFPDAKVIHSQRPEDSWWKSYSTTIGKALLVAPTIPLPPHIKAMLEAVMVFVADETLGTRKLDREKILTAYRKRAQDVKAAIPPERLLVYDVAQGWEPLCAFLGVPVPDQPFPHLNTRDEFWEHFGGEPPDPV